MIQHHLYFACQEARSCASRSVVIPAHNFAGVRGQACDFAILNHDADATAYQAGRQSTSSSIFEYKDLRQKSDKVCTQSTGEWELKGIILSEVENRKIASLTP